MEEDKIIKIEFKLAVTMSVNDLFNNYFMALGISVTQPTQGLNNIVFKKVTVRLRNELCKEIGEEKLEEWERMAFEALGHIKMDEVKELIEKMIEGEADDDKQQ